MTVVTIKARDPDELVEQSWAMVDEALTSMSMHLQDGTLIKLTPFDIVMLVKWLAMVKTKKLKVVSTPEDFILPHTGSEDIDE